MKFRNSFVSNSSSSSFIIYKEGLTEDKLAKIREYGEFINCMGEGCYFEEYNERNQEDPDMFDPVNAFLISLDNSLYDNIIVEFFERKFNCKIDTEW